MKIKIVIVTGAMALLSGCGIISTFEYPENEGALYRSPGRVADKTVAVLPFEDCRDTSSNRLGSLLTLIPLVPYGEIVINRPEDAEGLMTAAYYRVKPSEDLARSAATSLKASGMFADAFFTAGEGKDRADYVLSGKVTEFRYVGREYSYGLSIFGQLLWYFALPAGSSENSIACEMELRDRNGQIVWSYAFRKSETMMQGLYYNFGRDCKNYPKVCQDGMNESFEDMFRRLGH